MFYSLQGMNLSQCNLAIYLHFERSESPFSQIIACIYSKTLYVQAYLSFPLVEFFDCASFSYVYVFTTSEFCDVSSNSRKNQN